MSENKNKKIEDLCNDLSELTISEAFDLFNKLKDKFPGIDAAMSAAGAAGAAGAAPEEEAAPKVYMLTKVGASDAMKVTKLLTKVAKEVGTKLDLLGTVKAIKALATGSGEPFSLSFVEDSAKLKQLIDELKAISGDVVVELQ